MNVVIVDDDPKDAEKINSVVEGYMEARKLDCMIDVYTDPEAFLGEMDERKSYDLFLLDIFMGKMDGRLLCQEILAKYIHPICIFVTYSPEYAVECYKYSTFRYVLKSNLEEQLCDALDAGVKLVKERKQNFRFLPLEVGSAIRYIIYEDIFYIEKDRKYVLIQVHD